MAKPTIKLTKGKTETKLSATGDLNIQHAEEIKTYFLQAANEASLHLDLTEVATLDPAAIQMTYVLKKQIERDGKQITISIPVKPELKELLDKTGITKLL